MKKIKERIKTICAGFICMTAFMVCPQHAFAEFAVLESDPATDTVYVDLSSIMEEDSKYTVVVEFTNEDDDYYQFELSYFNDWHYTGTMAAGNYIVNAYISGSPGAGDYWAYTPFTIYNMEDNSSAVVNIVAGYKDFVNKYKYLVFNTDDYGIAKKAGNITEKEADEILGTIDTRFYDELIKKNSDKNGFVTYAAPTTYLESELGKQDTTEMSESGLENGIQEGNTSSEENNISDGIKEVIIAPSTEQGKTEQKSEPVQKIKEANEISENESQSNAIWIGIICVFIIMIITILFIITKKKKD